MLVAMVQSIMLFIAIVLGAGSGYFIGEAAFRLITDHLDSDASYIKQTDPDTTFCFPDQFTYV